MPTNTDPLAWRSLKRVAGIPVPYIATDVSPGHNLLMHWCRSLVDRVINDGLCYVCGQPTKRDGNAPWAAIFDANTLQTGLTGELPGHPACVKHLSAYCPSLKALPAVLVVEAENSSFIDYPSCDFAPYGVLTAMRGVRRLSWVANGDLLREKTEFLDVKDFGILYLEALSTLRRCSGVESQDRYLAAVRCKYAPTRAHVDGAARTIGQ